MTRINSTFKVRTALLVASLGLLGSAVMLAGTSSPAQAATSDTITLTSPNNVTIAESDDYATQVLGDPWDMNNKGDLNWPYNIQNVAASDGIWRGNPMGQQDGVVYPVYQNFRNSYSYVGEKDGPNYPVDSNRYSRFWVRMSSDAAAVSPLWFFKHFTYNPSGNSNFLNIEAGWHIYSMDLRAGGAGGNGNWTQDGPYEGLRFDMPWFHPGNNVQIDWMRLTPDTGQAVNIAWTYQGGASSTVNLYLSNSTNATQNNEYKIAGVAANSNSYNWNTTGMAPGTYYIHAEMNGAWSSSGPLNVNTAPLARVDAPSQLSGEDYAQAQLAQAWQSCGQFTRFINVQGQQCGAEEMVGVPSNNDPEAFWLLNNYNHTIDTNRYHYVNFRFLVAPPAARQWAPFNAGTRLIWQTDNVPHTTNLILAPYNEWIQAGFDMRVAPMIDGSNGWNGNISTLRFDPLEQDEVNGQPSLLPANFRVGLSHITSEPISGPGTIVRWTALQGNGTVDIYRDNNKSGYDGTLVASNVPLSQGYYAWDTAGLSNGTYWVYLKTHDNLNQTFTYSLAPIVVDHGSASTLFSDVPPAYWAADDINRLAMLGIINGSMQSDTTVNFRPGGTALRSQLSKMVSLSAGWTLVNPSTPTFRDVPAGHTFYQYIETAAAHGVISGYDCGGPGEPCPGRYFRPNNEVTRAQTAKMISLAQAWNLVSPGSATFADMPTSNGMYAYVETASANGIISGYACGGAGEPCDGQNRPYFRPGAVVTRAQLSKMLARSLDAGQAEKKK